MCEHESFAIDSPFYYFPVFQKVIKGGHCQVSRYYYDGVINSLITADC
jgi:hypothetical protein